MTKSKKWWFEKSSSDTAVYIYVEGKHGPEQLSHNQGSHRPYGCVTGSCVYEKDSKLLKVFFESGHPRAFSLEVFLWNASEISRDLRSFVKDVKGFSGKLNNLLGSPPLIEVCADVHHVENTSGSSQDDSDTTYNWDVSGDDVPLLGTAIDHSTPARPNGIRKRSSDQTQIPVLFKKKAPPPKDGEANIMEEVKSAYLGSARILTANLTVGPQIRQLNEAFVTELIGKMKEFPGHFYQPLCVVMESLRDCSSFRESNANGFHYKVIGGCHNLTAAKRLEEALPAIDVFKSRLCVIYKPSLSEQAVMWLANQHNKVGEFRHTMGLKEKIQLCRNLRQTCGHGGQNDKWKEAVDIILGSDHSKGVLKLLIKIAALDELTFQKLEKVLTLHSEGRLKQQRLVYEDIAKGPVMKPYALANIPSLPAEAVQHLLQSVIDLELTFAEFQKESKTLWKLQIVQRMFLDLLEFKTWNEAREAFPEETTRETLEHFIKFPLRTVPPELKAFCRGLKRRGAPGADNFKGLMGAVGAVVTCDALQLEEGSISQKIGEFPGAALIVIDKPKDWTSSDVRSCLAALTGMNLGKGAEEFTAVVLSSHEEVPAIAKAVEETRHFDTPMKAFYFVPNHSKSHRLSECIFGMTLATKGRSNKQIIWSSGHSQNVIEVQRDSVYSWDGLQVDKDQKPVQLYTELIKALTMPGQFVLDICCGTGTGIIAGLRIGRNVVGVEVDREIVRHVHIRVSKEVGDTDERKIGDDQMNVEEEDGREEGDDEGEDDEEEDDEEEDDEEEDDEEQDNEEEELDNRGI